MTHIANCIRLDVGKPGPYISHETSPFMPSSTSLERGTSPVSPPVQVGPIRYQLWPTPARSILRPSTSSDRLSALSMGRSPTSLSDTSVASETVPFWQRSGSLSRRRKVSVPELHSTMTTVQELAVDSPTIPGRPPLRKTASETVFTHERTCSAPGTAWRTSPFGDALVDCVSGPSHDVHKETSTEEPKSFLRLEPSPTIGKPLSPILSPSIKPALKVDTAATSGPVELRPQVPPKSPVQERRGSPTPLVLNSKPSRSQMVTPASAGSGGTPPLSAFEYRRSPNINSGMPTPLSAASNPFGAASPSTAFDRRGSPRIEKRDPMSAHNRNMSDTSIMDRGRPVRRGSKRQRSRTCSETNNLETPAHDPWKLPQGMRVQEASMRMSATDKETLHKQARDQTEKFEVLQKRDVASMSRELRALDERCDYLRRTYKSLRAGRQKLHSRMISYLKRGETVIFSRESLLKQEEALAELDISIDEFILKLEQAENRRLRLRQKLLEHVAAAVLLSPTSFRPEPEVSTPPRSPVKAESPSRMERREVESIKIYADGHVLNLFSDIEQAIGKMCEQAC
ncbi:hypothetical protein M011DRAFT_399286 [Sporormia fimetaria CBS 119925]|uniref:Up-regulated during septation protein 1 domain-containing protein n=1 Tax=Sporormia fimetaria CBS 119925 TaxID=1340428 RepID=A0A6A6VGT2_9PLEO|nr:hypothetical protein M011DRAFT_399286 [Sporormia fimetaria CBS 119925]